LPGCYSRTGISLKPSEIAESQTLVVPASNGVAVPLDLAGEVLYWYPATATPTLLGLYLTDPAIDNDAIVIPTAAGDGFLVPEGLGRVWVRALVFGVDPSQGGTCYFVCFRQGVGLLR